MMEFNITEFWQKTWKIRNYLYVSYFRKSCRCPRCVAWISFFNCALTGLRNTSVEIFCDIMFPRFFAYMQKSSKNCDYFKNKVYLALPVQKAIEGQSLIEMV